MKDQKQLLLKSLNNDVPVFVICGTDENAIETMEKYFQIAQKNGCDNAFLQDMKLVIEDFKAFREQEPEKVKLPDMSPQIEVSLYKSIEKEKSEEIPEANLQIPTKKTEAEVEQEINDCLKQLQKTGLIPNIGFSEDTRQFINNHFSDEIERSDIFFKLPDEIKSNYEWMHYQVSASCQLKAGDLLESKGLLPKGTTEGVLIEEGWNVSSLREEQNNSSLIYLSVVKQNGHFLEYIKKQTPELCRLAIQQDSVCIAYVKEQTPELCLEAVKDDGYNLKYVKEQTPEICLSAVKQEPLSLRFVNEQSPDVCIAAIKQNVEAFKYVKEQTPEICLELVRKDGWSLKHIKDQTREICLEAIKQDPLSIMHVKEQTPEICLAAVQQNGRTLHEVKEQTLQLCMEAVKEDGYALAYVKEQTPEMCLISVKQDGLNLQFVKEQTPEICKEAVNQNSEAVQFIKKIHQEQINNNDIDKLLEISKNNNVIGKIYELNGNDEQKVLDFTNRVGLTEYFIKAENSSIEVSDYNRFASNYFDGTETDEFVSWENIDRDFAKGEKTAMEDNAALKQAVLEKLIPLELTESKQIFESQVASAILLTGGTTEKEVFDVLISRMKNDHDYEFKLTTDGNYGFTHNQNSSIENKSSYIVNKSELDLAIKGVLNPNKNKTLHEHTNHKENKILESNQIMI